jgi:hypothetical protein
MPHEKSQAFKHGKYGGQNLLLFLLILKFLPLLIILLQKILSNQCIELFAV